MGIAECESAGLDWHNRRCLSSGESLEADPPAGLRDFLSVSDIAHENQKFRCIRRLRSWLSNTSASTSTVTARRNLTPGPTGCPKRNGVTAYHRSSRKMAERSGCATAG